MKDFLLFIPLTVIYLALRSTLLPEAPLPDLPLLIVFYIAYTKPSIEGAVMGFVLGYIDDVISGGIVGTSSFALIAVFLSVRVLSTKVHFSTPAVRAMGAAALSLTKGLIVYGVLRFSAPWLGFIAGTVLQAVVTGAFAPAFIAAFDRMASYLRPRTFEGN